MTRTEINVRDVLSSLVPDRADLVTRPTGRAVRTSIEAELARLTGRTVVVLDFSAVRTIDCSCADEIIAKLLLASIAGAGYDCIFLARGLKDGQIDDIEEVLRRQQLVLVDLSGGAPRLLGAVPDDARAAFDRLAQLGRAAAEELARELSRPLDAVRATLEELCGRRVLLNDSGHYRPPNAA